MDFKAKPILGLIAIGGGLVSLFTGIRSVVLGATSIEGVISIVLLLLLSVSLAAALGIQGIAYRRSARYADAMPELLTLAERISRQNPEILSGNQATEICDRVVDGLAKLFTQITGARCHVSIEILTPTHEVALAPQKRSTDYLVVNLSRDSSNEGLDHEDRLRHSVDGNASYREIFHDPSCSAVFFRDDVASDVGYFSSELGGQSLPATVGKAFRRDRWPLHYRSSMVIKICQADLCRAGREHSAVAFLWLRSPDPRVFDDRQDVAIMQRMSRAIAPIVTRCAQATKPTHDFRRQSASL